MKDDNLDPLHNNIRAARLIVNTVKSTLGPMGRDKMMVDAGGDAIVTNDGATIVKELDVGHPGSKMIVDIAKTQESICYDGTTSTIVLAGELLANSEGLFQKGVHPNIVCKGYNQAARMAIEYLREELPLTKPDEKIDDDLLVSIARTAVTGKTLETAEESVAKLCVKAVKKAGDAEKVRVLCLPGGSITDSQLFDGTVVNRTPVLEVEQSLMGLNDGKVDCVLVNSGLEKLKNDDNVQLQFASVENYSAYKNTKHDDLQKNGEMLTNLMPRGGYLFVRDNVDDALTTYLRKHNIAVVKRVQESVMNALSSTLRIGIAQTPADIDKIEAAEVEIRRYHDIEYMFVHDTARNKSKCQSTLILRGATYAVLDEIERGFDDALGVVSLVYNGSPVLAGGGSAYVAMASHLRQEAASIEGRSQMAILAFADSLEVIPATIVENAGHDPLDCLLNLRHAVSEGNLHFGPDVEMGGITDMLEQNVYEPFELVKQAMLSATEVTTAILKIDDIIAKRGNENGASS